ncbi:MAG: hypothetical protein PWP27_1353, partial [Clostridiales bacterium]|nr:hypothetical protein [Clostridiales bacterium]
FDCLGGTSKMAQSTAKQFINQRRYFRIQLDKLLCSKMQLIQIKGTKISTKNTLVCIKNISATGLCFLSHLRLPVNANIVLAFETQILQKTIELPGHIVRMNTLQKNIFEYGVEFIFYDLSTFKIDTIARMTIQ